MSCFHRRAALIAEVEQQKSNSQGTKVGYHHIETGQWVQLLSSELIVY
jgi:hypothetical protein